MKKKIEGSKVSLGTLLNYAKTPQAKWVHGVGVMRKQLVESSYPGRDGIGADVKVWNLCERCGEKLKPGKEVWLELDTRTNSYTDQEVPAEYSQGGFTFGKACAKKAIKEHKERS